MGSKFSRRNQLWVMRVSSSNISQNCPKLTSKPMIASPKCMLLNRICRREATSSVFQSQIWTPGPPSLLKFPQLLNCTTKTWTNLNLTIRWPSSAFSNSKTSSRFQWAKSKKTTSSSEESQTRTKYPNFTRFAPEKTASLPLKYLLKSAVSKELKISISKLRRFIIPTRRSSAFLGIFSTATKPQPNTCLSIWSPEWLRGRRRVWRSDNSISTSMALHQSRPKLSRNCYNKFFSVP